jgi:hypothetical protein
MVEGPRSFRTNLITEQIEQGTRDVLPVLSTDAWKARAELDRVFIEPTWVGV